MKKLLSIALLILFSLNAYADVTVFGRVTAGNIGISHASIFSENTCGWKGRTITNDFGYYALNVPSTAGCHLFVRAKHKFFELNPGNYGFVFQSEQTTDIYNVDFWALAFD